MKELTDLCRNFKSLYSDLFEVSIEHQLEDYISIGEVNFVLCRIVDGICELRLVLNETIVQEMVTKNPFEKLTTYNLEAFLVFTEELSHLIQLLQLADKNQSTSKLGLEKVAEVDKLILSSALLELQTGIPHLDLMKKLLTEHSINVRSESIYDESPKALMSSFFENNRSVIASSNWRRDVKKFKATLLKVA
jgi:hypothetical protein